MPPEVLNAVFTKILQEPFAAGRVTVVWHAGEPLALPVAWYEDAFARCVRVAAPSLTVDHAIQTNGLGLDSAWARFLRTRGVTVGLSIDGPADLHDARRRTRSGRGTHALAMRALDTLRAEGVPFHVITVITAAHLNAADRLFDFYAEHGIGDVGFNVEETEGANRASSLWGRTAEEGFRAFLRRFAQRVAESRGRVRLRELVGAAAAIAAGGGRRGNDENRPLRIVSVDSRGRVFSFSPELLGCESARHGDFVLGDILTESFGAIAERAVRSAMAREIARGVARCRASCEYFEFCGGGAPANKWFEHGRFDATETTFCRLTRKAVVDETLRALEAGLGLAVGPPDAGSEAA